MQWLAATRKQSDKPVNDDAYTVFGDVAVLLDGAGNAQGKATRAVRTLRAPLLPLPQVVGQLHTALLNFGAESTCIVAQLDKCGTISGYSLGNSVAYVMREGKLRRINESTRERLGNSIQQPNHFFASLQRHDCVVLASDGLTLEKYRLEQTIMQNLLRPQEMPEAILKAQRDTSDDVTVVIGRFQ